MSEHAKALSRVPDLTTAPAPGRSNPSSSTVLRCTGARSLTALGCIFALLLSTTTPVFATGGPDPTSVVVDVLVARPISLAATAVGAVLFVVSLPVAAASRSVRTTTATLVEAPAKDLFSRPVGDLEDWFSY